MAVVGSTAANQQPGGPIVSRSFYLSGKRLNREGCESRLYIRRRYGGEIMLCEESVKVGEVEHFAARTFGRWRHEIRVLQQRLQ